jgi:hypothetical protein
VYFVHLLDVYRELSVSLCVFRAPLLKFDTLFKEKFGVVQKNRDVQEDFARVMRNWERFQALKSIKGKRREPLIGGMTLPEITSILKKICR